MPAGRYPLLPAPQANVTISTGEEGELQQERVWARGVAENTTSSSIERRLAKHTSIFVTS